MKKHAQEELLVLSENIDVVADKMSAGDLSTFGMKCAEELLATLIKIKSFLEIEESDDAQVDIIIEKLPLLYIQIRKIN
ncbi:MAG: hypothetical protein QG567_2102 [Campylobacterota bacterium]|nr:hypothetical protein [Campylobacterota bacterium]